MSLFKAIEWWGTGSIGDEECDFGCLCVANIDNASNGADKVIVGSYQGILHIYSPIAGHVGGTTPHDVLLEAQLPAPILQLAAGRFVSVSPNLHLAVLLPRSLTIYAVAIKEGAVDHGNQCILNKIYGHKLERTAANMTYGPFGGVKDKDFLCVQSMDGTLSIFESENFTFMRFIPGFLMPGPLAYSSRMDSFITVSSNRCLESYSFQVLAVAAASDTKEESQTVTSGKRIKADWQFILGEGALDIRVVPTSNSAPVIMVLGERNLYCVQETGQLVFMKKLGYNPACFHPYTCSESQTVKCIVCTHSKQLLVYEGLSLKWATVMENIPVQVVLGSIGDISGMIVTLTDRCEVSCSYLGTHPATFSLPRSTVREPDYSTIDQEMEKINDKIRELHASKGDALSQTKETDDLSVKIDVPPTIDKVSVASQQAPMSSEGPVPSITVQVILKASKRVTNVSVMIHVDDPLTCSQKHITLPAIGENEPMPCITVSFYLGKEYSPAVLSFEAIVYYQQTVTGNPKIVTASAQLPLTLVSWPHDPIKAMEHKVTLEGSTPCLNLLELFPELSSADAGPNCVGIKLIHGCRTTILASKSSNRYRVQSDTFAGLWLVAEELVKRIGQKCGSSCKLTHPQPVNLDVLSPIIDRHFQLRISKVSVREILDLRAKQFRAIQRRLLTRFKDKTPAPLNCLDTLLEGTYRQILALADACMENAQTLIMSNIELSCALRLTIMLSKLWLDLSQEETQLLELVFCINMRDSEMGWEETVGHSLMTIIRTVLSKAGNETGMPPPDTSLKMPHDVSKIKKQIAILFDRLSKGARLIPSQFNHENQSSGPISNISIGQAKSDFVSAISKARQPPLVKRGISEENVIEEEDEDAIIDDILSSGPSLAATVLRPPEPLSKPKSAAHYEEEIFAASSNLKNDTWNDTGSTPVNGYRAVDDKYGTYTEEEPTKIGAKSVLSKSGDDVFGAGDDVIESPSFYDNTSDDTYAM